MLDFIKVVLFLIFFTFPIWVPIAFFVYNGGPKETARKHVMRQVKRDIELGYNVETTAQAAMRELIAEGKLDRLS